MAKSASESPQPAGKVLLLKPPEEVHALLSSQISKGREILSTNAFGADQLQELSSRFKKWSDYNEELLRAVFSDDRLAREFSNSGTGPLFINPSLSQQIESFHARVRGRLTKLESIDERVDLFDQANNSSNKPVSAPRATAPARVFIVHGRNEAVKHEIARFLTRLDLEPIVLAEQPNEGRTIIEKMEANARVDFAVVLLTGDDIGALAEKPDASSRRARQNVILELGYFAGLLGRARVCPIYEEGVELPSDILGLTYVAYDGGGAWKMLLLRELRAANLRIDANKAF